MKPCVLYFSRTGNTKRFAEAIAQTAKAPIFNIASSEPKIVEPYDLIILGTPTEGSSPTKEALAFMESLPRAEGKKAIVFCTCRLWKGVTLSSLSKKMSDKGYETVLGVAKKMKVNENADFSEALDKINKVLQKS